MKLTFEYVVPDAQKRTTHFAYCYPFAYSECQLLLSRQDQKYASANPNPSPDDIYYHREQLTTSLEGRRIDLLTVSSHHGITEEREDRLEGLFPEVETERAKRFSNKKVHAYVRTSSVL